MLLFLLVELHLDRVVCTPHHLALPLNGDHLVPQVDNLLVRLLQSAFEMHGFFFLLVPTHELLLTFGLFGGELHLQLVVFLF